MIHVSPHLSDQGTEAFQEISDTSQLLISQSGHVPSIIINITLADLFNNRYDILTEDYDSWQKDSHLTI